MTILLLLTTSIFSSFKAALASLFKAELQLCVAQDAQEGGDAEQRALRERFLRFEDEAAEHLAVLNTWAGSMVQKRTG